MASEPRAVSTEVGSRIYTIGNETRHTDMHLKAFHTLHYEIMLINVSE